MSKMKDPYRLVRVVVAEPCLLYRDGNHEAPLQHCEPGEELRVRLWDVKPIIGTRVYLLDAADDFWNDGRCTATKQLIDSIKNRKRMQEQQAARQASDTSVDPTLANAIAAAITNALQQVAASTGK